MSTHLTEADRRRLLAAREAMLAPLAYQAGVGAWGRRMDGYREMLDSVHQALAVFDSDGTVLFRNQAFEELFRREPMWSTVAAATEELAGKVGRLGSEPARGTKDGERSHQADVTAGQCSYALWASPLRSDVFGTEGVLVEVERRGGVLPSGENVQARFHLTPREAEVALLLAEGLDNRRIAERLSISPHTARRHTEHVLRGLGIDSRAAVAVTLLQGP
jgi:DNA-binding CsgD family transcriptional regulator